MTYTRRRQSVREECQSHAHHSVYDADFSVWSRAAIGTDVYTEADQNSNAN